MCASFLLAVYRQLKASWDSRVEAIAALEAEMGRVRTSFEERERTLEGERSAAEEHARWEKQACTADLVSEGVLRGVSAVGPFRRG